MFTKEDFGKRFHELDWKQRGRKQALFVGNGLEMFHWKHRGVYSALPVGRFTLVHGANPGPSLSSGECTECSDSL